MAEDLFSDSVSAYLIRIAEEAKRAKAAAPNYAQIADAKRALTQAIGSDSISAVQAVVEKFPWIAQDAPTQAAGAQVALVRAAAPPPAAVQVASWAEPEPAVNQANLVKKTTGKMAVDPETGERRELKTIINPQGDIEAARLTKETGELHIVDPLSGTIVNTNIGVPRLPDGGVLERDPSAIMPKGGGDIRPQVSLEGKGLKDTLSM